MGEAEERTQTLNKYNKDEEQKIDQIPIKSMTRRPSEYLPTGM